MSHRVDRGRGRHTVVLVLLIALAAVLLGACSLRQTLRQNYYTVVRGDTLYAIAQRFDLNWHKLAKWNHIGPPYRLAVGQRLTLKPYPPLDYGRMPKRGRRRIVRAPQDSQAQQKRSIETSVQQLDRTVESSPSARPTTKQASSSGESTAPPSHQRSSSAPGTSSAKRAQQQAATSDKVTQKSPAKSKSAPSPKPKKTAQEPTPARVSGPGDSKWQWPVSGTIVKAYAPHKARKGIEIGGSAGAPVYAASGGRVVYNGPGLKGFGRLIIIKHPHDYLSAYGFLRQSRVKKGQAVKVGARIASMGIGPGQKPMLHFEIRRDGEPVNPERMLPDQ